MDNSLKPIEAFVKQGLAQRFQQLFGVPLVYSNAPDKKAAVAKLLQRGLSYPFAFASITGEAITEGAYKPHALWRRGLVSGASTDSMVANRLNLVPVTTEYSVSFICKSFPEVERFKKMWLLGSVNNALKYSVLFGAASLDIHVAQDRRVNVPMREGGLDAPVEYEATVTIQVQGYLSADEFARTQAVLEVEGTVDVAGEAESQTKLTVDNIPLTFGLSNGPYVTRAFIEADTANASLINISTTASLFDIVLAENRTIGFTGGSAQNDGKRFALRVTQDAPGGWVIAWGPMVNLGLDITEVVPTPDPGKFDYIGFVYRHAAQTFDLIAFVRGF